MKSPTFDDVTTARNTFLDTYHQYWLDNARFSWQWWLLLITVIVTWVVWWKIVDKRRIHSIANFGFLFAIFSLILDMIGMNHGAWAYPIRLYWAFIPPLLPYDLTYLPVVYMLIYQRYGKNIIKAFVAFTITSAIVALVFEPFFEWIGVYKPLTWRHIYSFPIYIALAFLVRFIVGVFENAKNRVT